MLVVFSPIFVADTKIIYGPNLVAPLRTLVKETFANQLRKNLTKKYLAISHK